MPDKNVLFHTRSWKDIEYARRLADDLKVSGIERFFDFYSVRPGDNIADRISHGLAERDIYVTALCFGSPKSHQCNDEINAAISSSYELGQGPSRHCLCSVQELSERAVSVLTLATRHQFHTTPWRSIPRPFGEGFRVGLYE